MSESVIMVQNFGLFNIFKPKQKAPVATNPIGAEKNSAQALQMQKNAFEQGSLIPYNLSNLIPLNTQISSTKERKMYSDIVGALNKSQYAKSPQDNVMISKKLDTLLKNGKLLNKSSNNSTSTLENLHKILTTPRADGLSNEKILAQTVDVLYKPEIITQKFGDISTDIKGQILNSGLASEEVMADPTLMDVAGSGTCVASSIEYHIANKHPAEFARWVEGLSSQNKEVEQKVNLSALSKNPLEAVSFMHLFEVKFKDFGFDTSTISIRPDDSAYIRAQIQDKNWDKGERTIVDVLMQSTLMQLGSQGYYDSLSDIRGGKFSSNPQGLVETEKTFIESIIENNEKLSVRYQKVDDNQNLVGWECDFDKITKHIVDALVIGEDVIVGNVLTNETSGRTASADYKNTPDNAPNKIINGHEITIVDYRIDKNGDLIFICNDTDDDKSELIEYSAKYLVPKIHHAAYPVNLVEKDLQEMGQIA